MTTVTAADGRCIQYAEARILWENGEFSDWVDVHGFPLTIRGEEFGSWAGVEDALSDDSEDVE